MAIWECISWLPGFIGKMRRNENDFFLDVSCVKNYHFFTAPRWSEKALFCTIFFLWISILITGLCIWGGLFEFFENLWWKKIKNFPAQWHIKEFYNSNFFEFCIFCFKSLLWLFGSVFHGSQGSMAKCEEIRMIFFWKCHVWKITIFSQPRSGQKRHFFAQFFFLRISILITGRCIWGGLFEFFENLWWKKMINFPAQWHIKEF